MLRTNLDHILSEEEYRKALREKENLMICCGRMGPMCVPVYHEMELLRDEYPHVAFMDMEFDIPAAQLIKNIPACRSFMGLPFTVYFKNGEPVAASSGIQSEGMIREKLDIHLS